MKLRDLSRQPWVQNAAGTLVAGYLKLVWTTNRVVYDPPDLYEQLDPQLPAIFTFWHGQHFMMPFIRRDYHKAKVLISRHRDGQINALAVEKLGMETVRGSGDHGKEFMRKGGFTAFKEMLKALASGYNMALTADVPKVSRVAGLGIVMLARTSGRPIVPVAIATSRFIQLKNWDRSAINLPFGRSIIATSDPIYVPRDADNAAMELLRQQVERDLNALTRRAYAAIGHPGHG